MMPEILCARALYSGLTNIFLFLIFENEEKTKFSKKLVFEKRFLQNQNFENPR